MMSFRRASFLMVSALMLVPTPAAAQAQTVPAAGQAPPAPPIQAGFNDGFFIQTANGDNRLVFGFVGQIDGRFSLDDPKPIINTFTLRKFRPTLTGQLSKYFTFKFMISEALNERTAAAAARPSAAERLARLARTAGSDADAIEAIRKALDELLT